MALVICRECGKEISSEAFMCPCCGYPGKQGETGNTENGRSPDAIERNAKQCKETELEGAGEKRKASLAFRIAVGILLVLVGFALLYSGAMRIGFGV